MRATIGLPGLIGLMGVRGNVLAALILWAMVSVIHSAPSPQSSAGTHAKEEVPSPYLKWLEEDVVYIIADEERGAFLRLSTDEEREKFIEQFWRRRDPAPATPENEFKKEHYRRIAYANGRFGTASGKPGWQTDRGHMYILYGPPDELESHPRGAQRSFATDVWMYRHVESIGDNLTFTFIDRTGTGDYILAPQKLR